MTTPARTALDFARRHPRNVAVPLFDSLCGTTGTAPSAVLAIAARHAGARDMSRVPAILALVDAGAASPQESRTRLLLIDNGFPTPETQIVVLDERGTFVARVDMGYREFRIAIEYDGAQHWTDPKQHTHDIDRLARLESLDWIVIRISAAHLRTHPQVILTRLRNAFAARGVTKIVG